METETLDISEIAKHNAFVATPECVGSIVDNAEVMASGDIFYRSGVARRSPCVNTYDCGRIFGD